MTLRVVVADDQPVVRDGLVLLLRASGEVDVVGVAGDGEEAVRLIVETSPDVALLDLRMPRLDGAGAIEALATRAPGVPALVLTTFADDQAILPALRAGAAGYLTKDATAEQLLAALRDVAAGRTVLHPDVQRRLVEHVRGEPAPAAAEPGPAAAPDAELTRREIDVLRLVAEGLSNRQIAARLVLGEATIKTHLNHLLSKLDVDGRPGLVAWAWRHGYGPGS